MYFPRNTLPTFSNQNVWRKSGNSENALGFFISSQIAWAVWRGSVVWGRFPRKTHGLNAVQSKTPWAHCIWIAMAYQSKAFPQKTRSETLMKTIPKPYDFDNFGLGPVGEYFTNFSNQHLWGKHGKAKTLWAFPFQIKTHGLLDIWV